ncbi:MAG: hypothetical protein IJG57_06430 [Firmicutes bacterium]|nr:hypothetical protein [Bacillota bacterium]
MGEERDRRARRRAERGPVEDQKFTMEDLKKIDYRGKYESIKAKVIRFGKYVWTECKDWRTLVLLAIVMFVMYTPVWLGYILFHLFEIKWALAMMTGYMLFWAGPATPFIPLCIAITLTVKRFLWKRPELPEPGNPNEKRVTVYKKPKYKKKKDPWYKTMTDLFKYMKD